MKKIKDPIYGYINIEKEYMIFVDTPEFQRLRNIMQTGFQALYPSSLHNRFVHSLGVFHLGKKAIEFFYNNSKEYIDSYISQTDWDVLKNSFIIACLLHDVGHSPFSHTGEEYYKLGNDLMQLLKDDIKDSIFDEEITKGGYGKPHEAMSALIGMDLCRETPICFQVGDEGRQKTPIYTEIDNDFFVRAIIGLEYKEKTEVNVIKNAIIHILNGELIDVDKLDYIARDSFVTGYSSLNIDVERLISGYTLCKDRQGLLCAVYKRSAHSVIENVIFANDLERRWIQNHPTILYDEKINDFALRCFNTAMRKKYPDINTVFVKEALTNEGLEGAKLRLLCDDDIVNYIKNEDDSTIGKQFFSRNLRLKPLWKSEAEFREFTSQNLGKRVLEDFSNDLEAVLDTIQNDTGIFINDDAISSIEKNIRNSDDLPQSAKESYTRCLKLCNYFKDFCSENELEDFCFAAILRPRFKSSYQKIKVENIKIELAPQYIVPFKKMLSVTATNSLEVEDDNLFYIFTTKNNFTACVDITEKFIDFLKTYKSEDKKIDCDV